MRENFSKIPHHVKFTDGVKSRKYLRNSKVRNNCLMGGYLHARDGFDARGLPATSIALVDRPASDPSPTSAAKRGFWSDDDFDKTVEMTKPDVENVQPHCDETQRLTTQLLPTDAVASSEARLTTQDFCHERLAGPYTHLIAIACLGC